MICNRRTAGYRSWEELATIGIVSHEAQTIHEVRQVLPFVFPVPTVYSSRHNKIFKRLNPLRRTSSSWDGAPAHIFNLKY